MAKIPRFFRLGADNEELVGYSDKSDWKDIYAGFQQGGPQYTNKYKPIFDASLAYMLANPPRPDENPEQYGHRVGKAIGHEHKTFGPDSAEHRASRVFSESYYASYSAQPDGGAEPEPPGGYDFFQQAMTAGQAQRKKSAGLGRHTTILGGFTPGTPTTRTTVLGGR